MEIGPELVEGQFVERTNRFLARVIVAGRDGGRPRSKLRENAGVVHSRRAGVAAASEEQS